VLVTFAFAVALSWLYFDFHADQALRVMRAAAGERGRLGRDLSYLHIPIVAGVIVTAVANELVVADPEEPLPQHGLALLGAGPVLYLVLVILVVLAAAELPDRVDAAAPQSIEGRANTRLEGADR
jgi:low temperature requirement protein LtrA